MSSSQGWFPYQDYRARVTKAIVIRRNRRGRIRNEVRTVNYERIRVEAGLERDVHGPGSIGALRRHRGGTRVPPIEVSDQRHFRRLLGDQDELDRPSGDRVRELW